MFALLAFIPGTISLIALTTAGLSRAELNLRLARLSVPGLGALVATTILLLPILGSSTAWIGWRWVAALVYAPAHGIAQELYFRSALLPGLERAFKRHRTISLFVHAVICESVTAFVADKPRAVGEYARVIRPGGNVGLTEGTWITPPPAELAAYLARVMAGADFLAPDAWSTLLAGAGLTDLVVQRSTISARSQWKSELRRMDRDDLREYLRAWKTFGSLLFTSAPFRRYLRELWPSRSVFRMFDYVGYGVFVGRKSATGSQA